MNERSLIRVLVSVAQWLVASAKSRGLLRGLPKGSAKGKCTGNRRYALTQEMIDDVLGNELAGVRFSMHPVYNPRVRTDGKTSIEEVRPGFNRVKKVEIGPQSHPSRSWLIDTILHEELEARIALRAGDLFYAGEEVVHARIYRLIARFVRMKGL